MKKKKILIFVLSLALVFSSVAIAIGAAAGGDKVEGGKKINVWLIAGQSNAVGYGHSGPYSTKTANDPGYSGPEADAELLDKGVANVLYYGKGYGNDSEGFMPVRFGQGKDVTSSGAEIGIATALANSGEKHAIIKYANGDTQLNASFVGDEDDPATLKTWTSPSARGESEIANAGALYDGFIATVREGIAALKAEGYTPVIQGFWWMQGERDGNYGSMTAELYSSLLTALISDMRSDVGAIVGEDLSATPFVYGRVYRNPAVAPNSVTGLAAVQAAQDAVAANTSLTNVYMIDTTKDLIDLTTNKQAALYQMDGWHYDAFTQQMIGEAVVRKAYGALGIGYTNTQSILTAGNQGIYRATVNYVPGSQINIKLGSYELFSISDSGLKILGASIAGVYGVGDYKVYACINPTQNMTMVEVVLPGGGMIRRGIYNRNTGYSIVASASNEARVKNVSISYENLTLNEYELVTVEPEAEGFGANVYNLVTSFSDAKTTRLFAWTAKADFIGTRTMAIKYRAVGESSWTVVDAYKLDEPTPYEPEDYFKADVSGLKADTEYEYKIGVKGSADEVNEWSKAYTFTTAAGNEKEFTFIAVGDTQGITWNGTETANKGFMYSKSALDAAFDEVDNPAFILHTGDVVEHGLEEEEWNFYFKALGEAGASIPHFATPGNHDDNLGTADQNFYFGMHFNHPDNGGNAYLDETVVAAINALKEAQYDEKGELVSGTSKDANWTKLLIKYMDETFYSFNYGDAHFVVYNSGAYGAQDELMMKAQRAWLKADLEANKDAKWTIVLAHQPNYHWISGYADRNTLTDILEGFDVDLVIQGHSHLVARSYPMKDGQIVTKENIDVVTKGNGTVYMLVGAGALNHDDFNNKVNSEEMAVLVTQETIQATYATFDVTENSIKVTVKQVDGLVLDSFTLVEPEKEEQEESNKNVVYNDDFHYFTYADLSALGIWQALDTDKYPNAKNPAYSALRLKLDTNRAVQLNWLELIGGLDNYNSEDTYVFEFDAYVKSFGSRVLTVYSGNSSYEHVGLHNSSTTMAVGTNKGISYTYGTEETFRIKIEIDGSVVTTTVKDSKGTVITKSRGAADSAEDYSKIASNTDLQTLIFQCNSGEVYIDNFSFKSFSDVDIPGYGILPSNYADASLYPIVLFQGREFKAAYGPTQFEDALIHAANKLVDYTMYDAATAQILLRGDVTCAVGTLNNKNIGRAIGEIDINLNGHTVTQTSGNYFFYLQLKCYEKPASEDERKQLTFKMNVYNGSLNISYTLFYVGVTQNGNDYSLLNNLDVNFTNVNVSVVRGKDFSNPPKSFIFEEHSSSTKAGDRIVDFNFTFDDCVFDFSRYNYDSTFFWMDQANDPNTKVHRFNIDVNGGEIILSPYGGNSKVYETNDVSAITFGKGTDGEYLKLTVPTGVEAATLWNSDLSIGNEKASLKNTSSNELYTTYTLTATGEKQGIDIDGYGFLPKEYADASKYPIVLFQGGEFKKAFKADEICDALTYVREPEVGLNFDGPMTQAPADAMILLRGNVVWDERYENLGQTVGTIDINLNGFTIDHTDPEGKTLFYVRTKALSDYDQKFTLNVYNGNINLRSQLLSFGAQNSITDTTYTKGNLKDAEINFSNLNITLAEAKGTNDYIFAKGNATIKESKDTDVHYDVKFNDCVFDFSKLSKANVIFGFGLESSTTIDIDLVINGGELIVGKKTVSGTNPYDADLYRFKDANNKDASLNQAASIEFGKGSDGKYLKVTVPSDVTTTSILTKTPFYVDAPITSAGCSGEVAEFANPITHNTWVTYTMQPKKTATSVYIEGYGTIPAEYADPSEYPIVLFQDGAFKGAWPADWFQHKTGNTGDGALEEARKLVDTGLTNPKPAQILLRGNAISNSYGDENFARAIGEIDINLNGYTLTHDNSSKALFLLRLKDYSATEDKFTLKIRDGQILLVGPMFNLSAQSKIGKVNLNSIDIQVSNVNIVRQGTVGSAGVIFSSDVAGGGNNSEDPELDVKATFTDCTFNFSALKSVNCVFNLEHTLAGGTVSAIDLIINGGEIILSKDSAGAQIYNLNSASSVTLGKGTDGKYFTVSVPDGISASALSNNIFSTDGKVTLVDGKLVSSGNECIFVKSSDANGLSTYVLYPKVMTDYKIKSSITLYTNFVYNVYIPVNSAIEKVLINGNEISKDVLLASVEELSGVSYYKLSVPIPSGESLDDIVVQVVLKSGESSVAAQWTLGVVKYAEKVLAKNTSKVETELMMSILSYVRAAYDYFGSNESDAAKLAKIDEILGKYDEENPADMSKAPKNTEAGKGISSSTLLLGDTPSFIFYLEDGYTVDNFVFKQGNHVLAATEKTDKTGKRYLEVVMYAYRMCGDVTIEVTAPNEEKLTQYYNIYSYYDLASKVAEPDAKLLKLVERLTAYSAAALAYRNA